MPLDVTGRRYADRLFRSALEKAAQTQRSRTSEVITAFAKRNGLRSGNYIQARAKLLIEHIGLMGQARVVTLLKSYEKSGVNFDDVAVAEITAEIRQYCKAQQSHATRSIGALVDQTLGGRAAASLRDAVASSIVSGAGGIIARLIGDLDIKRDEIIIHDQRIRKAHSIGLGKRWDVFISHASEDKPFVRPLAQALQEAGLSVWYDETALEVGDSLRKKIDEGLGHSRYGIVVLSHQFFAKNWPQKELDGLVSKEIWGTKVILPVWHNLTFDVVRSYSPMLSGIVAANSNEGMTTVLKKLCNAMGL